MWFYVPSIFFHLFDLLGNCGSSACVPVTMKFLSARGLSNCQKVAMLAKCKLCTLGMSKRKSVIMILFILKFLTIKNGSVSKMPLWCSVVTVLMFCRHTLCIHVGESSQAKHSPTHSADVFTWFFFYLEKLIRWVITIDNGFLVPGKARNSC